MGPKNVGSREIRLSHIWAAMSMGVLAGWREKMRNRIDGHQPETSSTADFSRPLPPSTRSRTDNQHRSLGRRHLRICLVITQQTTHLGAKRFRWRTGAKRRIHRRSLIGQLTGHDTPTHPSLSIRSESEKKSIDYGRDASSVRAQAAVVGHPDGCPRPLFHASVVELYRYSLRI